MSKLLSLIKATMTEDMNLFKVSTKKKNTFTKILLPIFLSLTLMSLMFSYSEMIIKPLKPMHMEFVLLTIFIIITSIMTIIEGIYKSGNLLFNCKDDNLLFSLPLKKSTILFIRILKFYVFELMYNSIFLAPAIIVYAIHTSPSIIYYIVSIIGLLLFPIIPIIISCLIGAALTFISSKFKGKNQVQTILTILLLLGIMYFSQNSQNLVMNIAKKATSINDFVTKIYYPAGAYINLITKFNILKLLEFIIIHIGLFGVTLFLIGKTYFNINSSTKSIKTKKSNKHYIVKTSSITKSLIKKDLNRFANSPVFITNAGFGLVLFIIGCIIIITKFDSLIASFLQASPELTIDQINSYIPTLLFGFICFTSFMTSITSSMISLEGKSFNILKSLPVKPTTIVKTKVLTAVLIMIPCILIGDILIFIKFKFNILNILLILITSVLLPLISETIGIIINLKYPRMDAKNDTEVVKQSMSSMLSVFIGMTLLGITIFFIFKAMDHNISNTNIIILFLLAFTIIYCLLHLLLNKICDKYFNDISA